MAQGDITFIVKEISLAALSFPYEVQKRVILLAVKTAR